MKFFAICFILFVALAAPIYAQGLTAAQKEKTAQIRSQCREKVGASMADEEVIRDGKLSQLTQIQKCLIMCVNQSVGFRNKNGAVNQAELQEKLAKVIGEEKATIVNKECNGITGVDACDTASKIYTCHYNHGAAFLFLL